MSPSYSTFYGGLNSARTGPRLGLPNLMVGLGSIPISQVLSIDKLCREYSSTTIATSSVLRKRQLQARAPTPTNLSMLVPSALPDAFLDMFYLNQGRFQKIQKAIESYIKKFNQAGYVSPLVQGYGPIKKLANAIKFSPPKGSSWN